MRAVTLERAAASTGTAHTGRRMGAATVVAAAAALQVAFVASLLGAGPERVVPRFDEDAEVAVSNWGNEELFGVPGSRILSYRHDTDVHVRVPWSGGAVVGARLGHEPIRLLTVTDALVADGELVLTVHRDNCRYFHERAIDMFTGVDVTLAGGRTTTLFFDRPLLVKSPMLASCPDRTLDRQDDTRSGYDRYDR